MGSGNLYQSYVRTRIGVAGEHVTCSFPTLEWLHASRVETELSQRVRNLGVSMWFLDLGVGAVLNLNIILVRKYRRLAFRFKGQPADTIAWIVLDLYHVNQQRPEMDCTGGVP